MIEPGWPAPAAVLALATTRRGGCSAPPFESFNLAHHVGDSEMAVAANRALLARALPAGSRIQWLSQVHGSRVVEAGAGGEYPEADGVWTRERGLACAVLTADCLPVLLCDRAGAVVAAAHAGWRGLLAGVLETTVAAMAVDPAQIVAWLGPAIGPGRFEVGPEVREQYLAAAPASGEAPVAACFKSSAGGRYLADLYRLARLRLRGAGVAEIGGGGFCTFTDGQRFFSFRRDGRTGRMASLVLLRPG